MLRAGIVALVLSTSACLYCYRFTMRAWENPWHNKPTAFENVCLYCAVGPSMLVRSMFPHRPVECCDDRLPSVFAVAVIVGVNGVGWAVLLTLLYWISRYALRKVPTKPAV
jgi:hypothetical protein